MLLFQMDSSLPKGQTVSLPEHGGPAVTSHCWYGHVFELEGKFPSQNLGMSF